MKKFLSILLALAVGFTFTFGSAMSAFAATEYTVSTARPELDTVVTNYANMVSSAKTLAVSKLTYDETTGLCNDSDLDDYDKKAVDAAADAVEAAAKKALTEAEEAQLNAINSAGKVASLSAYKEAIAEAVTAYGDDDEDLTTADGYLAVLKADALTLNKSWEATQYEAVKAAIAKDYVVADYPNEGSFKDTTDTIKGTYTAQEVVSNALKAADEAIATAKKAVTDAEAKKDADADTYADAVTAYLAVYNANAKTGSLVAYIAKFKDNGVGVRTNAQIAEDKDAAAKDTAAALASLRSYAIGDFYSEYKADFDTLYADIKTVDGTDKILYIEDTATGSTKATVLGVEIAKKAAVTDAEQKAIISALYTKINSTLTIAEKAANAGADVAAMYGSEKTVFLGTIKNAEIIADKYADVVKYADSLKAEYVYGKKVYDDTKIDTVLKAAEDVVYKDLGAAALKTAAAYFEEALQVAYPKATSPYLNYIKVDSEDSIAVKLAKAKADAKALFNGTIITSGADATPEADKVYKAELYVNTSEDEHGDTYEDIKENAYEAIDGAETFAAIDEALATAKTCLGQLMLAKDKKAVEDAQGKYTNAFNTYVEQQKIIMGSDYRAASFANAKTVGDANIAAANTEAAVKAAYDEAIASIAAIKKSADIKALEDAVLAQIKALPYSTQITAADKATVEAARKAFNELAAVYGADVFSTAKVPTATGLYAKLAEAEAAIEKLDSDDLAKRVKETAKKIAAITSTSTDAGAAAAVALKEEVTALADEIVEFNKTAANDNKIAVNAGDGKAVIDFVDTIKDAEIYLVEKAIKTLPATVTKEDAAAVKAAREAFDKLTDAQKAEVQESGALVLLENAEAAIGKFTDADAKAYVQDLAIAVRTVKSGKKVKVTVNADVQTLIDNGFTVEYKFYKSTKKSSGYKNTVNKTTNTYTNTNPVKGKNYYKVKLVVKNADGEVVATTPLTQCKYGVRTMK